jgi:hypothetical protein
MAKTAKKRQWWFITYSEARPFRDQPLVAHALTLADPVAWLMTYPKESANGGHLTVTILFAMPLGRTPTLGEREAFPG